MKEEEIGANNNCKAEGEASPIVGEKEEERIRIDSRKGGRL